jgi:cell division protein FtsZ
MTSLKEITAGNPGLKKTLSLKVLGVGGAGCNVVNHLASQPLTGLSFTVMNTDAAALAQSAVEARLVLGSKSARGLGAGGDPEQGRAAAEEDLAQIRSLCEGHDMVFVVAGLGGGTGTGAGPVIAQAAKEAGALVLGIVILPFDCEGARRQRQAVLGLHELKGVADGVICLPNQKILKLIDEKTSLPDALHLTNELVAEGVRGIWRLLSRPGLINVDFADLCAVLQGKHGQSSLATAEAKGDNRAREVIEKLLAHPLIEGGQALTEASGVLVSIAGGPEMALSDVQRIMEQVNRNCEHAHIIMGAAVDDDLRDRLMVTLIASRRQEVCAEMDIASPPPHAGPEKAEVNPIPDFPELQTQMEAPANSSRPPSRFVAPPPALTVEKREQLLSQQAGGGARQRKNVSRMRQGQLPLEIISKGRFEKSEPTIHHGQDLDVPTYIRRGVALN